MNSKNLKIGLTTLTLTGLIACGGGGNSIPIIQNPTDTYNLGNWTPLTASATEQNIDQTRTCSV